MDLNTRITGRSPFSIPLVKVVKKENGRLIVDFTEVNPEFSKVHFLVRNRILNKKI